MVFTRVFLLICATGLFCKSTKSSSRASAIGISMFSKGIFCNSDIVQNACRHNDVFQVFNLNSI
jgi:hypothetical protein